MVEGKFCKQHLEQANWGRDWKEIRDWIIAIGAGSEIVQHVAPWVEEMIRTAFFKKAKSPACTPARPSTGKTTRSPSGVPPTKSRCTPVRKSTGKVRRSTGRKVKR
jgi:hypothetical protein